MTPIMATTCSVHGCTADAIYGWNLCEPHIKLADLRTRIETKCKEIEARMQHCGSVEFNPDDILEISREFRALLAETEGEQPA